MYRVLVLGQSRAYPGTDIQKDVSFKLANQAMRDESTGFLIFLEILLNIILLYGAKIHKTLNIVLSHEVLGILASLFILFHLRLGFFLYKLFLTKHQCKGSIIVNIRHHFLNSDAS